MPTLVTEAFHAKGAGPLSLKPLFSASGVKGKRVTALSAKEEGGISGFIQSIIHDKPEMDSPFLVLDLGVVMDLMDNWTNNLPTVQPFYAVKCNPNPCLLGALAALGSSFDCASRAEIESVLSLGVSPDKIIYANPCKSESHIKYAASVGVNVTTFDSKEEIDKIRKWHPKCELLIRIKPPGDSGARNALGLKYGALPEEVMPLLQAAQNAGLKVTGVSFHIGSGGADSQTYHGAIAAAKRVFDMASSELNMPRMKVLDIGGGFTCGKQFEAAALHVNEALQVHFGDEEGVVVIGEPGRYFAESAFTLASKVIGKRVRGEVREYWIDDGIYGSLNCIMFDFATVTCSPLACSSKPENPRCRDSKTYPSTVFGPTCDSLDTIFRDYQLPELGLNDWLVFPNMGAYTTSSGTNFNGFSTSAIATYLACSSPIAREQAMIESAAMFANSMFSSFATPKPIV
nr:lysine/ornithine decarboxylase [Sophora flavescens]QZJ85026.1 lysine/ornithine decarboxylase [Sophora flavescens]QZJ85027.1 lysine/ornithine decarboxylase [Sophora flavescens]QZJ85029.1 lysine/ornithine decarboxylase [Sophora flavescens]QZJ85030.1 lysine/ornithine decarboxylase [Sophora flavescens]